MAEYNAAVQRQNAEVNRQIAMRQAENQRNLYDYQLRSNLFLYMSGQNVFDVPETLLRFGSQTPGYAKVGISSRFGVAWTAGLKGTF